ncbi:hypothetical protein ONZ43_g5616 [Nemania bipapillata]|uniref:Uncharacterized protein n=1 Tax=Nemania bipapillata TaxID=110536 RepID=A0ACC2I8J5_9PEZI|nr:hypothetical protein ONZ43_g5616 [Nemania bipapillata]
MGVDLCIDRPSNGILSALALMTLIDEKAGLFPPKLRASEAPRSYNTCVHQIFEDRARAQPGAIAIDAWDGQFTYAELDALSTSLAAYLAQHGVGPEAYVPVCSEKSCWVPVAMLAILKAGGGFVLLDPTHPVEQLKWMCQIVGATKIVASKQTAEIAKQLAPEIFISSDHNPAQSTTIVADVIPSNVAYAVFTSGSSGRPKAVAIEHRAFCSSAVAHAAATSMNAESRVLQFASYAFDACLTEILTALIVGACVCIPSEEGRIGDLVGEARRLQPNWALLTPSVARILDVADFSMLRTLVLGGEAISENDVRRWAPNLNLYVAYGVSESAVINFVRPCSVNDIDHANLGFGVGVEFWLVEPDNHECLATAEAVGELVLGGPAVGREYIGDPTRTAAAFIELPTWYRQIKLGSTLKASRLYKTGDLCTRNPVDGSIQYVGRKDDQRKFHGQRLELAEIEHCLRNLLPGTIDLVVDVVKSYDTEILVAFVLLQAQENAQYADTGETWLLGLQSYSTPQILMAKRAPSTHFEKLLQQLWATVLNIPGSDIGLDDSFTELGGTSIHLMKLAGAARQRGVILAIGDVLRHESLAEMAASLTPAPIEEATLIQPFSLIPETSRSSRY